MSYYSERLHKTIVNQDGTVIDSTKSFRKVSKVKGGWSKMYKKSYAECQESCVASTLDLRIWNQIIDKTKNDFTVTINISKMASDMKTSRQKIHQFIKRSIDNGFIKKIDSEYLVNPFIIIPFGTSEEIAESAQTLWNKYV